MEKYKNFKLVSYIRAYDIDEMTDNQIGEKIDSFMAEIHLDKVYIENHRGIVSIPKERMRAVKAIAESRGLEVAGGITCTTLVNGIRKPSIFDTYCYTDPAHKAEQLRLISELAEVFDEFILDDFFFTACRCEMCIEAKGKRSWKEYRLELMENFAKEAVAAAKKINPRVKYVIKYPNWYESYQECGFNPGKQKDIFDGIYTGTETRSPYSTQHLQRYESYSIMRLMEATAPGRNGGGWVDPFDCDSNMSQIIEQLQGTLYGKAKEMLLWNLPIFGGLTVLPAINKALRRIDDHLGKMGNPIGVKTWEPFNGDGEDQLYNYLGMCGIAIDPSPYFTPDATTVLFTESTAEEEDSIEKLEEYVRKGGNAVVTLGYFKKMYDKGIKDFTSVRLTGRHVIGGRYRIQNANSWNTIIEAYGKKPVMYEILDYKTNATNSNISVVADENNFPVMTEDNYGRGRFFLLNVPENFADLYKLPAEVIMSMAKHISMGQEVYLAGEPKYSLYAYDNNIYAAVSYNDTPRDLQIVVRNECKGIRDIESGTVYSEYKKLPEPNRMMDATTNIEEAPEYSYCVKLRPGQTLLFEIIR